MEKNKYNQQKTETRIMSSREIENEVEITMDGIRARKVATNHMHEVSEAEIKAALGLINPDEASMESRG